MSEAKSEGNDSIFILHSPKDRSILTFLSVLLRMNHEGEAIAREA